MVASIGRTLVSTGAGTGTLPGVAADGQKMPIKMLNDRLLVKLSKEDGERTSSGGILIPATAQIAKRLVWGEVVALGPNVRSAEAGDQVLFSPDDRYEVEVQGEDYIMLRERDLHAVAGIRIPPDDRRSPSFSGIRTSSRSLSILIGSFSSGPTS